MNNITKRNYQTLVRGGCQIEGSANVQGLSKAEVRSANSIFFWGQTTVQEMGIRSAVRGKKEKTSPVLLKGSFMSRS
jgi:hypothetical protein